MPARLSSPIPAATHAAAPVALAPGQCRSLLSDLAHIADPRHHPGQVQAAKQWLEAGDLARGAGRRGS